MVNSHFKVGDRVRATQDGNMPYYTYKVGAEGVVEELLDSKLVSVMRVRFDDGSVGERCACYKFERITMDNNPMRKKWARRANNE